MKFIDEKIEKYAIEHSSRPSSVCDELQDYTLSNVEMSAMLIGKMEASFLGFLIRMIKPKVVVEIGTFTGYSALAMAEQMPEDSVLHTIDINPETNKVAKEYWGKSQHGDKIKNHLGPAIEVLDQIDGEVDFCFIDADKNNYKNYFEKVLTKLSPKGVIALDNVLWEGKVLKSKPELPVDDYSTLGLKEINDYLTTQDDLFVTMLPIRDGITLIQKR